VKAAWSQTSVIIIEDLHWLDEASQDFLETWMAAVEGTSVLMVLTFRPDWSPPSRPAWYRELALPELGLGEVGQVIRDLVGDGPGLDRWWRRSPPHMAPLRHAWRALRMSVYRARPEVVGVPSE
jgi:hypothetical protein